MSQVKVKAHPSTDTYIVPSLFHSSFVVEPKCSPKDMEDMVSTGVNIEDDREIVDAMVGEELENIDDVSAMDIDVCDDDCEEEDISLKDQKYTHLEATEAMDIMIYYMAENALSLEFSAAWIDFIGPHRSKGSKERRNNLPFIPFSTKK